jgi:hypothetical protein
MADLAFQVAHRQKHSCITAPYSVQARAGASGSLKLAPLKERMAQFSHRTLHSVSREVDDLIDPLMRCLECCAVHCC